MTDLTGGFATNGKKTKLDSFYISERSNWNVEVGGC